MALAPGDRLQGRYRIEALAGRGGMARVHAALDEATGETVAIKELRADVPEHQQAFRDEFAWLLRVSSPFLTRVHDFGTDRIRGEPVCFYTAEWIDGYTLTHVAEGGELVCALEALLDALEGLEVLHGLSLRHGDMTPDNVLVRGDGRGVLIDLGCALPFGVAPGTLSGTPGFVAPELLEGKAGEGGSDLYAVGITLDRLHRLAKASPSARVARVMARLADGAVERRPGSVTEVLELLGRERPRRGPSLLSPRLFGREADLSRFERWLGRVVSREEGPRVLVVHGAPGAGVSRVVREMVGRAESRCRVLRARASDRDPVGFLLRTATGVSDLGDGARAGLLAARALSFEAEPVVLVVEAAARLPPSDRVTLSALGAALAPAGAAGLVVELGGDGALAGVTNEEIVVGPLDVSAVRLWTRGALSERALAELMSGTGGLPARIVRELSAFGPQGGTVRDPGRRPGSVGGAAAIVGLGEVSLRALSLLAAHGGSLPLPAFPAAEEALAPLSLDGFLVREGGSVRLSDDADLDGLAGALGAERVSLAHAEIAAAIEGGRFAPPTMGGRDAQLLFHLVEGGAIDEAERRFAGLAPSLLGEPRLSAPRLVGLGTRTREPTVLVGVAEVMLAAQEPARGLSLAARALRLCRGELSPARLLGADALIRLGKSSGAERAVRPLLGDRGPVGASAWSRVARARLQRGDPAGARSAAEEGLLRAGEPETVLALRETAAVAASYLGRPAESEVELGRLIDELGEGGAARDRCRLLGQRAIAAFRLGRPDAARESHARALEIAERAGLDDLVAVSALNLGTCEHQAGNLAAALSSYERGLVVARAAGRISTELTLLYNLANLRAEIGDVDRSELDLAELERRAGAAGYSQFAPAIAMLLAEISLHREDVQAASARIARAEQSLGAKVGARERTEVALLRAELELVRGETRLGRELAERALEAAEASSAEDLALRAEALVGAAGAREGDRTSAQRLELAIERARRTGQRLLEARLAAELFLAADVLGIPGAPGHAESARRLFDRLAVDLPEDLRQRFYAHPRRARVFGLTRTVERTPAAGDAQALRRLLSLTRRMNSSLSLDRVLDYAVEAAVELCHAERGFLLLVDGTATRVAAARDGGDAREPPSSSIVRRAMESEAAVLTTDAQADPRFATQGSVHAMRLKSVLCVPIATPRGPIGALYVDSRVQRARFTEAERDLLAALADQAAIAVGNARLHAELGTQASELAEQKRLVERLSRGKDTEITRLRREVDARQRALELRYDYSSIVGRGSAMRSVLSELDRICETAVNVVVRGESGTGKELVARAIHFNGPRRAGPFVGINCAALPENLLESELFGHVRGAFTGADRDKKGLMVEANGGTLFLDELGELPLSMQAKLLRVLQEREVRPVGAARSVALDLRLVCATHRDLEAEVAEGRFREDLYYRVAVVTVRLPPLRDRLEDLPALTEAILSRLPRPAGHAPKSLSPLSLRILSAHPWPGNVRELENALTRASVLSTGDTIEPADLDLGRGRTGPGRARSTTRRGFEDEERARILELLRSTRWNVSVVSRTLGIPRNSLYRKLARYGVSREQEQEQEG